MDREKVMESVYMLCFEVRMRLQCVTVVVMS